MSKYHKSSEAPKPIAVETGAYEAIKFYAENYETLVFKALKAGGGKENLGTKPPKCRFCHKENPDVKFSKDAHVVPAFVGNKVLFSYYECDTCNDRFSSFEDDLAKMTMGDRALGQVPKRKGFTPLKPQGKKSSFERTATGVVIKQYVDEGVFTIDEENSRLLIKYDTQPYRPLGAYKALAKMAYGLMPEVELEKFEELRQWLLEKDVSTKKIYGEGGHWCYQTFVPGPAPFSSPVIALLKRKADVKAPYMMFFIAFGNWSYQIFVPCPKMDIDLADHKINVVVYPHYYMLQPWRASGVIRREELIMDDATRKAELRSLSMRFDSMRKADKP